MYVMFFKISKQSPTVTWEAEKFVHDEILLGVLFIMWV